MLPRPPRFHGPFRDLRLRGLLPALEHFPGLVGKPRAFASRKCYVAAVRPALEAVDDVGQARAAQVVSSVLDAMGTAREIRNRTDPASL